MSFMDYVVSVRVCAPYINGTERVTWLNIISKYESGISCDNDVQHILSVADMNLDMCDIHDDRYRLLFLHLDACLHVW
jgi:hypothetical protein